MTININLFSDYFDAMAKPPQGEVVRPMTMEEALEFHEELLGMKETLRLDDKDNGCNWRADLIRGLLAQRRFESGTAILPFDYEHKWIFHSAAYGVVSAKNELVKVAFDPANSDLPELMPDFEARWIAEGAIPEQFMMIENSSDAQRRGMMLQKLVRLHSWSGEPNVVPQ